MICNKHGMYMGTCRKCEEAKQPDNSFEKGYEAFNAGKALDVRYGILWVEGWREAKWVASCHAASQTD